MRSGCSSATAFSIRVLALLRFADLSSCEFIWTSETFTTRLRTGSRAPQQTRRITASANFNAILTRIACEKTGLGYGAATPRHQRVSQIGDRRQISLLGPDPISDRDVVKRQVRRGAQPDELAARQFAPHQNRRQHRGPDPIGSQLCNDGQARAGVEALRHKAVPGKPVVDCTVEMRRARVGDDRPLVEIGRAEPPAVETEFRTCQPGKLQGEQRLNADRSAGGWGGQKSNVELTRVELSV